MKLSFKYNIANPNKKQLEIINDLTWHIKKVMNILLYDIKEGKEKIDVTKGINIIMTPIYRRYREENWHSKYLHSHMLQEAIMSVIGSYKSYVALKKKYEKDSKSLKGEPGKPRYKQVKEVQEIVFTKYAIRIEGNVMKLSLSKKMQEKNKVESLNFLIPRKLKKQVNFSSIKMIKVKSNGKEIEMNIIYEKEEKEVRKETNIMAIDIGINNIVACTNKDNNDMLLVSGREAKSKNKYLNEKIKKLEKINMKKTGSKNYKETKQIKRIRKKRKNYMNTFMHKVSRLVIKYAEENKCSKIVVGDLKEIKQNMNYNKDFVQIPLKELVEKIEYKAKLEGIEVEKISERYTSGVSAIDKEEIKKENYNKKRRKYRGLFITEEGKKINADINGSLNILRKYIKSYIPNQEIAMDNGREQRPIKKRVA